MKLQAVSGRTNTQPCPTWRVRGEKIPAAFPRGGHRLLLGRGRARAGEQTGWGWWEAGPRAAGGTAGLLRWYSLPVGTLQWAGGQHRERGKQNKLCALVCALPPLQRAPQVISAVLLDRYRCE